MRHSACKKGHLSFIAYYLYLQSANAIFSLDFCPQSNVSATMHFYKLILSFIATSAICAASPLPQNVAVNAIVPSSTSSSFTGTKARDGTLTPQKAPGAQKDQSLQKKQAIIAVVTIAAGAALAKLTEIAIEIAADTIKNLGEWNKVSDT